MRVFVSGANGFIGRALSERLSAEAVAVGGVDLAADAARNVLAGDISEAGPWTDAVAGADCVVHTAAAVSNAVTGTGIGLAFACLAGLIVAAVTPEQTGVASGMNANIRTIGGSIGTAVMASIVTAHFLPSGFPKEVGYTAGFVVLGGALLAAAVAGLMIPSISEKGIEDKLEQERLDRELAVMSA